MNILCSPSKRKPCNFCNSAINDDLKMGKLYQFENIVAHYYCLLLSSGLCQRGRENEGILGFLPPDITKELNRGSKLRCTACKKVGATIGCCNKACKKVFHLPCSLKRDSLHLFYETFMSYCKEHKPRIKSTRNQTGKEECFICLESLDLKDPYYALTPPCCKNGHFHKECIQKQALSAGYFFKCPLCNNTEQFKEEMLSKGIFIPEQDAAWELEQNAFQDLYTRHSKCDAASCQCPMGNDYDRDDCAWEVVLCKHCGSSGCHVECGKISRANLQWECPNCLEVINKMKNKAENVGMELNREVTTYILQTPEKSKPPNTPPRRRRCRFAQLNEYNLSPNGPINKDDDCSLITRSPRSYNSRYGERLRSSLRIGLREYMQNEIKLKMEGAVSKSSTSKSDPGIIISHEKPTPKVEPKTEYDVQNENSPRASTSRMDDTPIYSRPGPKSRKRHINEKCVPQMELRTKCKDHDENRPQTSELKYSKPAPKSCKKLVKEKSDSTLELNAESNAKISTSSMNATSIYSRPGPKSKKMLIKYENIKNKSLEIPTLRRKPHSSQTICSHVKTDIICTSPRKSTNRTRPKVSNKGNEDIRQYFYLTK